MSNVPVLKRINNLYSPRNGSTITQKQQKTELSIYYTASFNRKDEHTHTRTHACMHEPMFNGPLSGTNQVSRYQKGKTNLHFTEATDSEWQWHQLGHMQVCISLQSDNTPASHQSVFLQAWCPSCRSTNSVKALKASIQYKQANNIYSANIKNWIKGALHSKARMAQCF